MIFFKEKMFHILLNHLPNFKNYLPSALLLDFCYKIFVMFYAEFLYFIILFQLTSGFELNVNMYNGFLIG